MAWVPTIIVLARSLMNAMSFNDRLGDPAAGVADHGGVS
jgi:hypothetical protein